MKTNQKSVLIVDRSHEWGPELRSRLAVIGIQVHVVHSEAAALIFANTKKIDVAIVEFAMDQGTQDFCAELRHRHIPCIYTAAGDDTAVAHPIPMQNGSAREAALI